MKIIFIGTTEFGIPTLERLKKEHELVLIITQPDRPVGRKQVITPPPIKLWSQNNNIQVLQPEKIVEVKSELQGVSPDLAIVAAYGQIIPKEILDIPKHGSINIHGSLLPKYRGASPIQATIYNGDSEAGITLIKMDEQMDHGPVIAKEVVRLSGTETFAQLYEKLSKVSADLVVRIISGYVEGKIVPAEQVHSQATFTKLLGKDDGRINWTSSVKQIERQIRAYNPEPGTWTTLEGKMVKILAAHVLNESKIELPGKIYSQLSELAVKSIDGSLIIDKLQPEGKNVMTGKDFLNGLKASNKLFV